MASADAPLSLHQLTALALSPAGLIDLAADLGCSHVGLFTCLPPGIATRFPCISTDQQEAVVAERLQARGVRLNNAEVFALRAGIELDGYREGLQRASRLGARVATVHIHEPSPVLARTMLAQFCDLAAEQGLRAALEFTSFSGVRSLDAALDLLDQLQHPAVCVALDALHFFRNGGRPSQLQDLRPGQIGYLQLCDGPLQAPDDLYHEAVAARRIPGAGDFPLVELLVQAGPEVMLDVEVPRQADQINGSSVTDCAAAAVTAARQIMRQATGASQ